MFEGRMKDWRPKPKADADLSRLRLTGEEGFVLSRLDGATSVENLVHLTGMPANKVAKILDTLVDQGAVERGPAGAPGGRAAPSTAPSPLVGDAPDAAATALHEISPSQMDFLGEATVEEAVPADVLEQWRRDVADKERGRNDALAETTSDGAQPLLTAADAARAASDDVDASEESEASADDAQDDAEEEGADGDAEEEEPVDEAAELNYRKLYQTTYAELGEDDRVAAAKSETGARLCALCFDPLPVVVRAIFENSAAGFPHARLVANHHRTPQGLDAVVAKPEFLRDAQVQRMLLRNVQLAEPQLKKLLQPKRLALVYKVTIDRDVAERNRQKARNILRSKWSTCQAEERADLIFQTEGRCLTQLAGLPFDSHTTTLLCARPLASLVLVQNLARFASTPPPLLSHLMKQPMVKRQPQLRALITQHPNCPAEAKRKA